MSIHREEFLMPQRRWAKRVLKVLDAISDILDSSKFTIFWMSLLLISAVLGLILKFMN